MKPTFLYSIMLVACLFVTAALSAATPVPEIVIAPHSGRHADLAAREIRRYFYLRCGTLLQVQIKANLAPDHGIVLLRKDSTLLPADMKSTVADFGEEDYLLKTSGTGNARVDWIVGGGDIGVLYGAYRFAEKLGVRFYLHGDVIPDERTDWRALSVFTETGKPLFATRGILPFHDFPEGPDWWTKDDYALYFGQLPKMRMNFVGLHCYPESRVGPEPLVWIGQKEDLDTTGNPTFSYPAFWFNSLIDRWGFAPARTSEFASGAGLCSRMIMSARRRWAAIFRCHKTFPTVTSFSSTPAGCWPTHSPELDLSA